MTGGLIRPVRPRLHVAVAAVTTRGVGDVRTVSVVRGVGTVPVPVVAVRVVAVRVVAVRVVAVRVVPVPVAAV